MKALIIGGGGFVGKYLAEHLMQDRGWETVVTKLPKETVSVDGCEIYNLDILDQDAVEALLIRLRPDVIFTWRRKALWHIPGKIRSLLWISIFMAA